MENLPNYDLWKLSEPEQTEGWGRCYDCEKSFDELENTINVYDFDTKRVFELRLQQELDPGERASDSRMYRGKSDLGKQFLN